MSKPATGGVRHTRDAVDGSTFRSRACSDHTPTCGLPTGFQVSPASVEAVGRCPPWRLPDAGPDYAAIFELAGIRNPSQSQTFTAIIRLRVLWATTGHISAFQTKCIECRVLMQKPVERGKIDDGVIGVQHDRLPQLLIPLSE